MIKGYIGACAALPAIFISAVGVCQLIHVDFQILKNFLEDFQVADVNEFCRIFEALQSLILPFISLLLMILFLIILIAHLFAPRCCRYTIAFVITI